MEGGQHQDNNDTLSDSDGLPVSGEIFTPSDGDSMDMEIDDQQDLEEDVPGDPADNGGTGFQSSADQIRAKINEAASLLPDVHP